MSGGQLAEHEARRAPLATGGALASAALWSAATAIVVGLVALGSLGFGRLIGAVAPVWLANAVWLIFLMRAPPRLWPALLASGACGMIVACKLVVDPWLAAVGASAANGLEVLICAAAVRSLIGERLDVGRGRHLIVFSLIALAACLVSATVGAGVLTWGRGVDYWRSWWAWAASDLLAMLILAPPLTAITAGGLARLFAPGMRRRTLSVFAALFLVIGLVSVAPSHPLLMLTPPLLMLAALQLEICGAALCLLVVTAVLFAFVGLGWTPLLLSGRTVADQLLSAQAFLLTISLMTFPIATVLARRRELEAELRASSAALAEANRQARMAENLAGIGYWRTEFRSDEFSWSEQMYKIYGLEPANGPPGVTAMTDFVHPDDRDRLLQHRRLYGRTEAPELDVRIVRPDGEIRHVITRSMVERDEQGAILARFGTLADITDIKRAEAAALESEQRYRFLADNAPDMISRTSLQGGPIYVSPSSVRVFGYTPEEMMSQNAQEMVHPDDFERVMQSIFQLIEDRKPRLAEPLCYRARNKAGEWIWVEANPMMIADQHGEPIEFVDIVRNVTQTKLFEAELDEARKRAEAAAAAKSAFLANMSHELRTPLTSIIGFSRLMGEREDLTPDARHFTRRIKDASEALLSIINDVLDFSKLEVGQVELEQQPLSVRRLLEETTGLIAIQATAKGVDIRVEADPDAPEQILGDVARLRQVLLNFLSNAVKFTAEGSVTVRTERVDRGDGEPMMRVSVVDTGGGVAPENVPRLFERFSQAEVSINRTHGGTGLGLAICKGIVELMGGTIGVETELGKGSTFWFEIPAVACEAAEALPADMAEAGDLPPLRLLVVDDTSVNRELVKLMLAPLGFEIREASGGAEAIEIAQAEPFDLILMDVRMPGIDGLEATRTIRAGSRLNGRCPILALTADVQPDNAAACRAAGMDDVLAKPIVPGDLLAKIVQWGAGPGELATPQDRVSPASHSHADAK